MKTDKQLIGDLGEEYALAYLQREGYQFLEKNWRYKKAELDIIVISPEGLLVFVEVKTRSTSSGPTPAEKVNRKKEKMIIKGALAYIDAYNYESEIRFDIIAIQLKTADSYSIEHFEDAFWPGQW